MTAVLYTEEEVLALLRAARAGLPVIVGSREVRFHEMEVEGLQEFGEPNIEAGPPFGVKLSLWCERCGIQFPNRKAKGGHMKTEHGPEPELFHFAAASMGMPILETETESDPSHMLPPVGVKFSVWCPLCGTVFRNRMAKSSHMKKVHGPGQIKSWTDSQPQPNRQSVPRSRVKVNVPKIRPRIRKRSANSKSSGNTVNKGRRVHVVKPIPEPSKSDLLTKSQATFTVKLSDPLPPGTSTLEPELVNILPPKLTSDVKSRVELMDTPKPEALEEPEPVNILPPEGIKFSVWCPRCGIQFPNRMAKSVHMRRGHGPPGVSRFPCQSCPSTFSEEKNRKRHEKKQHTKLA